MNLVKVAMTETRNVFSPMPARVEALEGLADRLEDVRRANVEHNVRLIEQAAALGCRAIGLGELFPAPYFALRRDAFWRGMAEDARSGPTVTEIARIAEERRIVVIAPIYELDAQTGKRFNTAVVVDASGEVAGRYRKTHVPEGRNEQGEFAEPFYFGASDASIAGANLSPAQVSDNPFFPVFVTEAGRIGVAICYDRHFEGVVRSLAAGGAQIVFSPAVTFGEKSARLWEMELQVDAARHRVFICGSNRSGAEPPWNQEFFGKSYVAGPDGKLPCEPAPPGLVIATCDLDQLDDADSSGWKLRRDRRPGIYTP